MLKWIPYGQKKKKKKKDLINPLETSLVIRIISLDNQLFIDTTTNMAYSGVGVVPPNLKSIQHYLKTADEHDKRDQVISYYCKKFLLNQLLMSEVFFFRKKNDSPLAVFVFFFFLTINNKQNHFLHFTRNCLFFLSQGVICFLYLFIF